MTPEKRITNHEYASDPTDVLIRNWVKDSGKFVECWEFESADGRSGYTYCADQDGGDWIEDEWDLSRCSYCKGTARISNGVKLTPCPYCNGTGKMNDGPEAA